MKHLFFKDDDNNDDYDYSKIFFRGDFCKFPEFQKGQKVTRVFVWKLLQIAKEIPWLPTVFSWKDILWCLF